MSGISQPAFSDDSNVPPSSEFVSLFDSFCIAENFDPENFGAESIEWKDVPEPLSFMNTYGHPGKFYWIEDRGVYAVSTAGAAHLGEGAEQRCSVASNDVSHEDAVKVASEKYQIKPMPSMDIEGERVSMMFGSGKFLSVTSNESGWTVLRKTDLQMGM